MSNKNYWVRSGSYAMMQRGAIFIFGFGSFYFMVRYYSKEDFGVWPLFVLITSIVEMSRSAFVQNAFIKFFSEPETDHEKLITASIFLNFASVLLFIIIMLALVPVLEVFWHTTQIGSLVYWYCLTSLILVPFTQLNYVEQANHSFKGVFWGSVARQGFFFVVVVITYFFVPGLSLTFYASMQTAGAAVGVLTVWILSGKYMPRHYVLDWVIVRRLIRFGKYILGTGMTSTIGKNTDQILLGRLPDHGIVAMYNAAIRIMNFIDVPSLSISNIVYPKIAESASRDGKYSAGLLYEKSVASILGFILPVILGVLVVPKFVLLLIAGPEYTSAYHVLRIIMVAALFIPFNIQVGSAFEVIGKPHVSFYINLTSNILNVILNLILISLFGAIGAATALLLTILSIFVVSQVLLKKELNIKVFRVFSHLLGFYQRASKEIYSFVSRKVS